MIQVFSSFSGCQPQLVQFQFLITFMQMLSDDTRKKLENIVNGLVIEEQADSCTTIRNLLCTSFSTSRTVKKDFEGQSIIKEKQVTFLKALADERQFWVTSLPEENQYLTRGGEARVYLYTDGRSVIKINDAVYYATWLEYFNSLVIHNLLFPGTAYEFIGFIMDNTAMEVLVKQPFIKADTIADLETIRQLLAFNGFENTRRYDYLNKELGIILEDIHDENVLSKDNILFFIDTVFYTIAPEADK